MRRVGLGVWFSLLLAAGVAAQGTQPQGTQKTATATFAGGCFWCVEADFDKVEGVISTTSGYIGGIAPPIPPTRRSCEPAPATREAVELRLRPGQVVSYEQLLEVVLAQHRLRWTRDGQFCDRGDQYRSAIFCPRRGAEAGGARVERRLDAEGRFDAPLGSRRSVPSRRRSTPPRTYHQDYYEKNPIRYKFYRYNCGRDARLEELWGKQD